jgi:signal transduction histidine kinase
MIILKVIINSAHHLENVVNDALDIQRIENGQFEPFYDFFDIREALKEVQDIMNF